MSEINLLLKATLRIYFDCAKLALAWLAKNWTVLIASVALIIVFYLSAGIFSKFGIAGRFMLGLTSALFTAQYYSWISSSINKEKINFSNLAEFNAPMFFRILGVGFILLLLHVLTKPMSANEDSMAFLILIYFSLVFAFNALPEAIYIQRLDSTHAFTEALKFTIENWIEWYIPFILFLIPAYFFTADPVYLLLSFAMMSPLLPGIIIIFTWSDLIPYPYLGTLFGFIVSHWFMLFRGFLFKELAGGTRRRRVYQAKHQ